MCAGVQCNGDQFTRLFNGLFGPTPHLRGLVSCRGRRVKKGCVSVSFHFAALLKSFASYAKTTLPMTRHRPLVRGYLRTVSRVTGATPSRSEVLMATSDSAFLTRTTTLSRMCIVPNGIKRVSCSGSSSIGVGAFLSFLLVTSTRTICLYGDNGVCGDTFTRATTVMRGGPFRIGRY